MGHGHWFRLLMIAVLTAVTAACGSGLLGGGGLENDTEVERMVYVREEKLVSSWVNTYEMRQLAEGAFAAPRWSPAGDRIVYIAGLPSLTETQDTLSLKVMNHDGSRVRTVALGNGNYVEDMIRWSSDGLGILFATIPAGNPIYTIWRADATTSDSEEIYTFDDVNEAGITDLAWYPDGGKLVASKPRPGTSGSNSRYDLVIFDLATLQLASVEIDSVGDEFQPSVSPDGSRIAFIHRHDGQNDLAVYTPLDGTVRTIVSGGLLERRPIWSAAGDRIACARNNQVFVVNADGTGLTQVTTQPSAYETLEWSPTGERLAYRARLLAVSTSPNSAETYLANLTAGTTELILNDGRYVDILWVR